MIGLAVKSLWFRRGTAALVVLAVALSVALLLATERVRTQARSSFQDAVSGVDLIVAAPGSPVQTLLSTVFHLGFPTSNLGESAQARVSEHPAVEWTVPLLLGDTHRGYRLIGTSSAFFERYRYRGGTNLRMAQGEWFASAEEAVIGAEAARNLGYRVGSTFVAAHGAGSVSFIEHEDSPFRIVGVLERTGTPVDRAIYVSLEGYDRMHEGFAGAHDHDHTDPLHDHDHERTLSAMLVGLKSRSAVLGVQRALQQDRTEPVSAVMPGDALQDLWGFVSGFEGALAAVGALVAAVSLAGVATLLLAGLRERRRELAILRAVGARPGQIAGLLAGEALLLTAVGAVLGILGAYAGLAALGPVLLDRFGVVVSLSAPTLAEMARVGTMVAAGLIVGLVPAWFAYRASLSEGMAVRL